MVNIKVYYIIGVQKHWTYIKQEQLKMPQKSYQLKDDFKLFTFI